MTGHRPGAPHRARRRRRGRRVCGRDAALAVLTFPSEGIGIEGGGETVLVLG